MAYRGPERCHLCGASTKVACPSCGDGVCVAHTLATLAKGASEGALARIERIAKRRGGTDLCAECFDREIEACSGPQVAIYRGASAMESEMLAEALRDEGFEAHAVGTHHAALIGAGQHIFEQRIEVPEAQADDALELLTALAQ